MPNTPLRLRDVFDPEQRIDRFIFLLSETVADLGAMESRLKANLFGEATSVAHSLYLQRHLAARVVDSWRVIAAIRDHQDIQDFVGRADAGDDADWLLEMLTRKVGSAEETPIEKIFRVERHRTIHLAEVDDDKLRETLDVAGDEPMQIGLFEEEERMVIEFPEGALTRAVFGDPADPSAHQRLAERAELIEETLRRFGALWGKSLSFHLTQLGIDPRTLHVARQGKRTTRGLPGFLRRTADWLEERRPGASSQSSID